MLTHAPGHTRKVFDHKQFRRLVEACDSRITELRKDMEINALAASGNSGLPLLGALSFYTGLPMLAVRKTADTQNDTVFIGDTWDLRTRTRMVNGTFSTFTRYLIVDDLIDSGRTIRRIIDNIETEAKGLSIETPCCVGILLYDQDYMHEFEHSRHSGKFIPCFHPPEAVSERHCNI